MAAWNTGQLGQELLAKEQEKLLNPIQVAPVNKEQNLKEIVRKYQESQYYNYSVFLGELGQLGYCTLPIEMPTILEIVPKTQANDRACGTYAEHRQRTKRENDTFECNNENPNKKFKTDDGWGDESATTTSNSGWGDENGIKSANTKPSRPNQSQSTWDDDDDNKQHKSQNYRSKGDNRKNYNSANRMQTGWSDEENDQSRNSKRFGESRGYNDNNDRGFERRGGGNNDRGFRGRGRGRGRGRCGQWDDNNNDRYNNKSKNNESAAASGWSDDESKSTTKSDVANNNKTKIDPIDDWDNPQPTIKQDSVTNPSTASKVTDDGWDD
ncbi:hypothetical protein ACKWTF_003780 [Chironomus riparius]